MKKTIKQTYILFDGREIEVLIFFKDIKNIYIKLNKKNEIIVSAPKNIKNNILEKFIETHLNKFAYLKEKSQSNNFYNLHENYFYFFGNKIFFQVTNNYFYFNDQKIKISQNNLEKTIKKIYKKYLLNYLVDTQNYFERLMEIERHSISILDKKSAWGTNYIEKKKINYSLYLCSFSKEIINYVIVHELAHNKIGPHSTNFWKLVQKYEPLWKLKRKALNTKNYKYY
ncbi:MAG: YgjP-like metallopeptidase domain-containing protein [Metamycoplasmataceae bacterium]